MLKQFLVRQGCGGDGVVNVCILYNYRHAKIHDSAGWNVSNCPQNLIYKSSTFYSFNLRK